MSTTASRWTLFGLWTAMIFAGVPVANLVREALFENPAIGPARPVLLLLPAVALGAALAYLGRRGRLRPWGLAWLLAVAAFGWWQMRSIPPSERFHVLEYAVLSVLAFLALRRHYPDAGAYLAAAALTALVGLCDEILQWLAPSRFWDLGDLGLDAATGLLTQLALWRGFRPPGITSRPTRRSLRTVARILAAATVLLLFALANTPERTDGVFARVPGLGYLGSDPSTRMTEYGFRHHDPEIGVFRSRFAPGELERVDRERGDEAGKTVRAFRGAARYGEFLRAWPPYRDPLVYEARVHLHHRNRYWGRARKASNEVEKRRLATLAWRENRILERYYPRTLAASGMTLRPGVRRRQAALHDPAAAFDSEVSDWLLTGFSETQARVLLLVLLAGLVGAERTLKEPVG